MSQDLFPTSGYEQAVRRDHEDPLAPCRELFELPPGLAYFDGNSLGPPSADSRRRLRQVAEQEWGGRLVAGWNGRGPDDGWIGLAARAGRRIARLIGAAPDEVLVADSTSVNLFKLLAAALELRPGRRVLLCQEEHFPTDLYIAEGLARLRGQGFTVRRARTAELPAALSAEVAVVCCSHVDFRSGELHDMAALNREARRHGALTCWDLSHTAGALPIELDAAGADLAVGCGYKFLNGGPGAPAFLFVRGELQESSRNPLPGWLGHADPFAFAPDYRPAAGIERFLCGTPPILSLASLDAALEAFAVADLHLLRRKSLELGDFFRELLERRCPGCGFEVVTPREHERRGSQISLRHPEAFALVQALIAKNVVPDFRAPDLLRFGLTPLYQRFADVVTAVETLRQILIAGFHREARFQVRSKVT